MELRLIGKCKQTLSVLTIAVAIRDEFLFLQFTESTVIVQVKLEFLSIVLLSSPGS